MRKHDQNCDCDWSDESEENCDCCQAPRGITCAQAARGAGVTPYLGAHLNHCNFGENRNRCKYGDDICPALTDEWSWIGRNFQEWDQSRKKNDMIFVAAVRLVDTLKEALAAWSAQSTSIHRDRDALEKVLQEHREIISAPLAVDNLAEPRPEPPRVGCHCGVQRNVTLHSNVEDGRGQLHTVSKCGPICPISQCYRIMGSSGVDGGTWFCEWHGQQDV